ncbi:MAG: signal peptide peptidase SppA [Actinobacteria bacterium]|nr:signal peptide peptidase SppA [Actinomycetota bacterium]
MNDRTKKISAGRIIGFVFAGLFVLFVFSSGCFLAGLAAGGFSSVFTGTGGGISSGLDTIYLIRLEGTISATGSAGLLGSPAVTPEYVIEQLRNAEKNPSVKAILIRVNSGGGSAAASQEIYEELKKVDKPVVVSVGDICASGAYYISCAADEIVANRTSAVGSIGVIMQIPNLEELYDKIGIKYTTIKQGKYKDVGSSDRPITDEEKELFKKQTFKIYEQFVSDVATSRNIPVDKVREIATGWVYIGTEALDLGLVDSIGTYRDAERIAARLGGIKGEPVIIGGQQFNFLDMILDYSFNQVAGKVLNILEQHSYPVIN